MIRQNQGGKHGTLRLVPRSLPEPPAGAATLNPPAKQPGKQNLKQAGAENSGQSLV